MRQQDNLYLLVAVFSLCIGLVTLLDGQAREIGVMELLLAIISAMISLRV